MLIIKETEFIEDSDSDFASDEKKKQEDLLAGLFSYLVIVQFHGNLNKKKKKKKKK